jgi:hypothetical protein
MYVLPWGQDEQSAYCREGKEFVRQPEERGGGLPSNHVVI